MRVADEIWQDRKRIKLNASEVTIDGENRVRTLAKTLSNFEVVKTGESGGVVVDNMQLPYGSIYLFIAGRDNGMWLISQSSGVFVTAILDVSNIDFNTTSDTLTINFRTRLRPYCLIRLH